MISTKYSTKITTQRAGKYLQAWQVPPVLQQGGAWKNAKKIAKGVDPEHFSLIRGVLRSFFMFSWWGGGQGVLGPFLVRAVPLLPAMTSLTKENKSLPARAYLLA